MQFVLFSLLLLLLNWIAIVIVMKANGLENDFISPFHLYLKIQIINKKGGMKKNQLTMNVTNIHPFLDGYQSHRARGAYMMKMISRFLSMTCKKSYNTNVMETEQSHIKTASDRNSDVIERAKHDHMSRVKPKMSFKKNPPLHMKVL